jgi:DNA-binding MarR family transcriptional regulator
MSTKKTEDSLSTAEIAGSTVEACIAMRVRRMSRIVTRIYDEALRPLGLTASQFTLLTSLAMQDGVTASEVGFDLDIEKSTLSRNLKRLLALELIAMDPPAGRRGRGLHLTPKGESAIRTAYPLWRATQVRAEGLFGKDGRQKLDGLLEQAEKLVA